MCRLQFLKFIDEHDLLPFNESMYLQEIYLTNVTYKVFSRCVWKKSPDIFE